MTTERTRKIPSQRGRTKETRRKRVRRGSGAGPATLEGSSPDGREPHSLMGREGSTSQRQAGQSETSADGPDPSPAPPSLRGCPPLHTRVGPQMWGLESRPRQRTAVGCEETPEGTGGREELCKRDACGGSLTHHSAEQRRRVRPEGKNHHRSPSPPTPAPPGQALAGTPTRLGDLTIPAATSSPMTLPTRVDSCAPR